MSPFTCMRIAGSLPDAFVQPPHNSLPDAFVQPPHNSLSDAFVQPPHNSLPDAFVQHNGSRHTHTHTHTTTQWSRHATNAGFYMVNVLPHRRSLLICAHVAVRRRHLTHPQDRVTRRSAPPRAARMDRPSPESGSRCASCTRRHPHCAPPRGRGRRLSPRACSISGVVQG